MITPEVDDQDREYVTDKDSGSQLAWLKPGRTYLVEWSDCCATGSFRGQFDHLKIEDDYAGEPYIQDVVFDIGSVAVRYGNTSFTEVSDL